VSECKPLDEGGGGVDEHCGLRAIGACVRTRVRVLTLSPLDSPPPLLFPQHRRTVRNTGRGLHSSTFQLNVSAFCGIGGAFRGCIGVI